MFLPRRPLPSSAATTPSNQFNHRHEHATAVFPHAVTLRCHTLVFDLLSLPLSSHCNSPSVYVFHPFLSHSKHAIGGHTLVIRVLLLAGFDLATTINSHHDTPLSLASYFGHVNAVRYMLKWYVPRDVRMHTCVYMFAG